MFESLFEEVSLKDGRKVKIVETNGLDEMIAVKVASEQVDGNNPMSAGMASTMNLRMVLIAFSVAEIDGTKVERPTKLVKVQQFMQQFSSKDLARIGKAYSRLNDDVEGENEAAEPNS